jgi:hypothetical protein
MVIAGLLTACTGTTAPVAPPTSSTSASTTASAQGLRGYPISSLACPTRNPSSSPGPPQPITGDVVTSLICPLVLGNRVGPDAAKVTVTPASRQTFLALDQALRTPDQEPVTPGSGCPAVGQIPIPVLVQTTDGAWSVHLPTDACGLYLSNVVRAITKARQPEAN